MKQNQKPLRVLLLLIPIILGMIGLFVLEKEPFMDALFHCVQMYVLNYSDTPPNLFVEAARWIAPLASAYSVLLIASALRTRLQNLLRSRHADAVAVYGPEEECAPLLAALDRKGVSGGSAPAGTDRHILLWNEEENFRFYTRYRDALAGKGVYLKCGSLPAQAALGADLHIFCPEETAARLYWKDHCLYEMSCACSHKMQIVLIGFGKLGSELLTSALQSNIFSPDQRIEYHVFGGDPAYLKIHHELGGLQDLVLFHEEPWQDNLALLESAERILIVQQEGQTELLAQLLLAVNSPRIDLFDANAAASGLLDGKDRIVRFPWKEIAYRPENILSEDLYRRAKALNLRYAHIYTGAAEGDLLYAMNAARLAPSHCNIQPWYFIVDGRDIHCCAEVPTPDRMGELNEFDLGIALAHIYVSLNALGHSIELLRVISVPQGVPAGYEYYITARLEPEK